MRDVHGQLNDNIFNWNRGMLFNTESKCRVQIIFSQFAEGLLSFTN